MVRPSGIEPPLSAQQAKDDNQRTGKQIDNAKGQIGEAEGHIAGAAERAERIEGLTHESQSTVAECEQLVSDCQKLNREAKSIINDLELANKAGKSGKAKGALAK